MKKRILPRLLGVCAMIMSTASWAHAQGSYRTEVELGYSLVDSSSGTETKTTSISIRQHLSDVNIDIFPVAEAAFLERISSVEASWVNSEWGSSTSEGYGLALSHMKPGLPLTLRAYVDTLENKNSSTSTNTIGFAIGQYLDDGLHLELEYSMKEWTSTTNDSNLGINAKLVKNLEDGSAYKLEGSITSTTRSYESGYYTDSYSVIDISGDFYPDKIMSIGIGYHRKDYGDSITYDTTRIKLEATSFISPEAYVKLAYSESSGETYDSDSFTCSFTQRF